jgi:hypothetical protein
MSVTFRGSAPSEWIEADGRRRAARLDAYCGDIVSCRVVVDIPHRHHERGNRFSLRIGVTVPGEEIAVNRASNAHASRQDLDQREWAKQFEVEGMRKDPGSSSAKRSTSRGGGCRTTRAANGGL